jgi:hypothetical protein
VFIYLVFLVISAILHQNHEDSVWNAQVRSFPWYRPHKLASSPKIPTRGHQVPIAAPQPRRPIRLSTQPSLSTLYQVERTHDTQSGIIEPRELPPAMQEAKPSPIVFYPLHIQAVLEPTLEPSLGGEVFLSPGFEHSQRLRQPLSDGGEPPPLWDWPRADIMSLPPPRRPVARKKVPASSLPFATEPTHGREGLPLTSGQDR